MNIDGKKMAALREMIFPSRCAVCGSMLLGRGEAYCGVCSACAGGFEIEDVPRCAVCGKPLISEKGRCMTCRKADPFAFDAVFAIFPYLGKYRQVLKAYKFGGNKNLARFFALKLLETPFARAAEGQVWVPVPPQAGKIKAAGWDQVEEIAKIIEKTNNVQRCLKRLPSKSQKELDKGNRLTNLKGKIRCVKRPAKNVLLFDDVFTTGSTLSFCAEELKNHGAERVCGVCLFYD